MVLQYLLSYRIPRQPILLVHPFLSLLSSQRIIADMRAGQFPSVMSPLTLTHVLAPFQNAGSRQDVPGFELTTKEYWLM